MSVIMGVDANALRVGVPRSHRGEATAGVALRCQDSGTPGLASTFSSIEPSATGS